MHNNKKMSTSLSVYGSFIQTAWVETMLRGWYVTNEWSINLLSGDAGTGKSTTIMELLKKASVLGMRDVIAVTASTKAAADLLDGSTLHSCLGLNTESLLAATAEDIVPKYATQHAHAMERLARHKYTKTDHACTTPSMRCVNCYHYIRRIVGDRAPDIIGKSILFIDEYSMMSETTFGAVITLLRALAFGDHDNGIQIILSGSVSQLPPPASTSLGQSQWFPLTVGHSLNLNVNFRHSEDQEYGDHVKLMQYNIVTKQLKQICDDAVVGDQCAMDPQFMPDFCRVFNSNELMKTYTKTLAEKRVLVDSPITIKCIENTGCIHSAFCKHLRGRFPKYFKAREFENILYENCVVRSVLTSRTGVLLGMRDNKLMCCFDDDEPVVVPMHTYMYKGWRVTFYPVYSIDSLNVFSAQGQTIQVGVIYNPPRYYFHSPLKAAAYVTLSRVCTRDKLKLSRNSFAPLVGTVRFFDEWAIRYKLITEMGYTAFPPT